MTAEPSEVLCRRVAQALVDAEEGASAITLDDASIRVLGLEANRLAATVPFAVCALAAQLARHGRAAVRLEAVRLMTLVIPVVGELARPPLQRLAIDRSAPVRAAAARALVQLAPSEAWDDSATIIDAEPTIVEAPRSPLPVRPTARS